MEQAREQERLRQEEAQKEKQKLAKKLAAYSKREKAIQQNNKVEIEKISNEYQAKFLKMEEMKKKDEQRIQKLQEALAGSGKTMTAKPAKQASRNSASQSQPSSSTPPPPTAPSSGSGVQVPSYKVK